MERFSLADVEQLEASIKSFLEAARPTTADAAAAADLEDVRKQFMRNGTVLLTDDIVALAQQRFREDYDRSLLSTGDGLAK